jgi:hypothetical protein
MNPDLMNLLGLLCRKTNGKLLVASKWELTMMFENKQKRKGKMEKVLTKPMVSFPKVGRLGEG